MRFLIFGDVVGKPGREAVSQVLPELRAEHAPDSVIVNVENMAHGSGISPKTMEDANAWHADVLTTGDHAWDNAPGVTLMEQTDSTVIRPANYPDGVPGRGYRVFTNGAWQVAVINLQGQVFFKNHPLNPFHYLDELLEKDEIKQSHVVLLDFHAEATSEKRAMGWHADGRVSAVWGTHTHVPTADAQILPKGTGYVSDIGMNGPYHSIIGGTQRMLKGFLQQTKVSYDIDEGGPLEVNALLLDVDPTTRLTIGVAHVRKILNDASE